MTPLDWNLNSNYPQAADHLGHLPSYINGDSSDEAWRQIHDAAISGWHPEPPSSGWQFTADDALLFPGLPPLAPCAYAYHLGERIFAYPFGFVCIVQLSGAFTVARVL